MAVPKRLRYEVLRRDDFACRYCGKRAGEAELVVDHVVPIALGGPDTADNLVAACRDCNAGKASSAPDAPIVDGVADDDLRWAEAIRRAAAISRANRRPITTAIRAFDKEWERWGWGYLSDKSFERDADWRQSIENFIVAGLTKADVVELVEVAMNSKARVEKKWAYFCGCAWRRIRERQEIARGLIETEGSGE